MRHASALLPYALAAGTVVVVSAVALGATVRSVGPGIAPVGTARPLPMASSAARATLSDSGRLAYWRPATGGSLELWVGDLEGPRRWTVATAAANAELTLMRWSPDGSAVAYVIGGVTVGIARLDGSIGSLVVPVSLQQARWKIVSFEWSPDATRIAATLRAGFGLSDESDVYVADARSGYQFERATTLGSGYAGRWIDPERLFVETAGGMVAILDLRTRELRPLTGMPVTSPLIGRDGRVWVVGGQGVRADITTQPFASGWVWSMTIDGDDLRREAAARRDQMRLAGILADGRPVVGVPGAFYFAADVLVPLAFTAGSPRRLVVSDDGKRVFGITDTRVLRIDPLRVPRRLDSGLPPADAASLLLSDLRVADVWLPPATAELARSTPSRSKGPAARLAFTLGRTVWVQEPDGAIRAVLSEADGFVGQSRWSPSGGSLAASIGGRPGTPSRMAVVSASGVRRWDLPAGFGYTPEWSPDGTRVAVVVPGEPARDAWTTQLFDPQSGAPRLVVAGRATWSGTSLLVLSDGEATAPGTTRTGQVVELVDGSSRRVVTDAARLKIGAGLGGAVLPAAITQVAASADPAYAGAWVYLVANNGFQNGTFVVVRVADGEAVWSLAADPLGRPPGPAADIAWAPAGRLLAWTLVERAGGPEIPAILKVALADPVAGATTICCEGRFAGWAPDGKWIYVARDEGLFAYPIDGGAEVRVGPIGVAVTATRP